MICKLFLLNRLKMDNNYSYEQIAKMLGYSKSYIWQIFSGKRKLSYEMAIMLATVFNLTPDKIFYEDFQKQEKLQIKINKIANMRKKRNPSLQ